MRNSWIHFLGRYYFHVEIMYEFPKLLKNCRSSIFQSISNFSSEMELAYLSLSVNYEIQKFSQTQSL